jgi:hypothetical protein
VGRAFLCRSVGAIEMISKMERCRVWPRNQRRDTLRVEQGVGHKRHRTHTHPTAEGKYSRFTVGSSRLWVTTVFFRHENWAKQQKDRQYIRQHFPIWLSLVGGFPNENKSGPFFFPWSGPKIIWQFFIRFYTFPHVTHKLSHICLWCTNLFVCVRFLFFSST